MIAVGIGEIAYSDDPKETIITYALGSCVAVVMHSSVTKRTAMAHVVLPYSKKDRVIKEAYYADVTVMKMLEVFIGKHGEGRHSLNIHLIGGADSVHENDCFNVGRNNLIAICSILSKYYVRYDISETGGHYSRTVAVHVKNGKIKVKRSKILI